MQVKIGWVVAIAVAVAAVFTILGSEAQKRNWWMTPKA